MQRLKDWLIERLLGVNRRIVYGLVGGMLICLWSFVGLWSWWERSSILHANAQVLDQLSTAVHEQTRSLFKQADTSLLVARRWMAEHPGQDPGTAPGFIRLIDELRQASDGLIDIRMVTRDGTLRYIPDLGQTRQTDVSDRDYFKAQFDPKTRGLYVAQPVVSRVTGKLGIPISMPVTQAGGNVAVIFAAIELDRIAGSFEAVRIKPRGTIALMRTDGLFLFRSPMDTRIIGSSAAQSPMWTQHMGTHPRGNYLSGVSPVDGLSRVVTYMRVQDYPLVVAVSAAVEDLLDEWRKNTTWVVMVALVISAFSLVLGSILLRTMNKEELARRELEHLLLTDPLTGVGNRRLLMQRLEEEILRAQRHQRCLTLVYLDLDRFKDINDQRGHDVGDTVLVHVAAALRSRLRQSDLVARFGGEEFVLVLAETSLPDGLLLVEQMRATLNALDLPGLGWHITASAGLAQWQDGESSASLLRRADQALYRAKQAGRDRSCADLPA